MFANHGALKKHHHQIEGINSRLDGLQAAILSAKLPYILEWTEKRIDNARLYDEYLKGIEQIQIPAVRPDTKHTYHLYVIHAEKRNELAEFLKANNIETFIHYPTALPNLPAYKYLNYAPADFPVSTGHQERILSLPMFPELQEHQIRWVADCIRRFYGSK